MEIHLDGALLHTLEAVTLIVCKCPESFIGIEDKTKGNEGDLSVRGHGGIFNTFADGIQMYRRAPRRNDNRVPLRHSAEITWYHVYRERYGNLLRQRVFLGIIVFIVRPAIYCSLSATRSDQLGRNLLLGTRDRLVFHVLIFNKRGAVPVESWIAKRARWSLPLLRGGVPAGQFNENDSGLRNKSRDGEPRPQKSTKWIVRVDKLGKWGLFEGTVKQWLVPLEATLNCPFWWCNCPLQLWDTTTRD